MLEKSETEKYFDEYRGKVVSLKNLRAKISKFRKDIETMETDRRRIEAEISSMQRIMTAMIDNDVDPVEAKLKLTDDDFIDSLWDRNLAMGATGATYTIPGSAASAISTITLSNTGLGYPTSTTTNVTGGGTGGSGSSITIIGATTKYTTTAYKATK